MYLGKIYIYKITDFKNLLPGTFKCKLLVKSELSRKCELEAEWESSQELLQGMLLRCAGKAGNVFSQRNQITVLDQSLLFLNLMVHHPCRNNCWGFRYVNNNLLYFTTEI